jgi:hypothetical protein
LRISPDFTRVFFLIIILHISGDVCNVLSKLRFERVIIKNNHQYQSFSTNEEIEEQLLIDCNFFVEVHDVLHDSYEYDNVLTITFIKNITIIETIQDIVLSNL